MSSSDIKLLIPIEKAQIGTDVPKKKQRVGHSYIQCAVKDQVKQTHVANSGSEPKWNNELLEFDLTALWHRYQLTMAYFEKRKLRKDYFIGGISLTVEELLDAVG